jgi:hypothetical protein
LHRCVERVGGRIARIVIGAAGMEELMEGDVVQLKSGGPKMTVDGVRQLQAKCAGSTARSG